MGKRLAIDSKKQQGMLSPNTRELISHLIRCTQMKVCHSKKKKKFHIGCQPGVKQQSTIVVEIFLNEPKIKPWDKTKQNKIIDSVTDAIKHIIVKKQTNPLPPRYDEMNDPLNAHLP